VSVAPPYGDGVWRLFNLAHDPGETRDLASVHPQKMKALQMAWDEYAQDVDVVLSREVKARLSR
jgi:arylsulfatase